MNYPSIGPATRELIRSGQLAALPTILSRGRLYMLAFDVMKRLPAWYMLTEARKRGALLPGQPVVETSSGTFAIGLAEVCERQHPCVIVTDPVVDPDLKAALEARGARVEVVDVSAQASNIQTLRKARRDEIAQQIGGYIPNQYENADNPASYRAAAEIICNDVGWVDVLVVPVGSGGSSSGIGCALLEVNPNLQIVAVDTFGSVLFGLRNAPRRLRGLGNGEVMRNVAHDIIDLVYWVSFDIALEGVAQIGEAGFGSRGITSGASWMVANHIAQSAQSASIVSVFPDLGWRYHARAPSV